jgi:hypothetical protein
MLNYFIVKHRDNFTFFTLRFTLFAAATVTMMEFDTYDGKVAQSSYRVSLKLINWFGRQHGDTNMGLHLTFIRICNKMDAFTRFESDKLKTHHYNRSTEAAWKLGLT